MDHPEWMREGARQLADDAEALLRRHELEDHDGEPCPMERTGMIAFLAHRIGYFDPVAFVEMLVEYQETHDAHVGHSNNGGSTI